MSKIVDRLGQTHQAHAILRNSTRGNFLAGRRQIADGGEADVPYLRNSIIKSHAWTGESGPPLRRLVKLESN